MIRMVKLLPFLVIALLSKACSGHAAATPGTDYITPSPGEANQTVNQIGGAPWVLRT